jgi:prolipoprotein diacylglyceryltransferase
MSLPNAYGVWAVRFPTQLLSAAVNLGISATLVLVERYGLHRAGRREETDSSLRSEQAPRASTGARQVPVCSWPFDGFLFLLYVELFSLKRCAMAFLREDPVPVPGPLSRMHLYAIAGLMIATVLILYNVASFTSRDLHGHAQR